ncbi:hypothetical protein [Nocardia sp. NPDC005366]|uniref:hypothetical protein n=1 Tax=Nocardia sp. NPDC005366 TaxID=3156878 RepID=UPI0033BEFF2D
MLADRDLVPDADPHTLSRFGHSVWRLDEAIFEQHSKASSLNFAAVPEPLRFAAKHYAWQQINTDSHVQLHRTTTSRPAIKSIASNWSAFKIFLLWLHRHRITEFRQITPALLDRYLDHLIDTDLSLDRKHDCVIEVRRLWCYRDHLPEHMRLPTLPPWGGDSSRDLFDRVRPQRDNLTRRIAESTMTSLLGWALRFVEVFSTDILAAHAEYVFLHQRSPQQQLRTRGPVARRPKGQIEALMADYLQRLVDTGGSLPGKVGDDGEVAVDWNHVGKVLACTVGPSIPAGRMLLESAVPVADAAYLDTAITAKFNGVTWRDRPIDYFEALPLARRLSTACLIVVAYLSGARAGEVLNLRRGCVEHDPVTGLWLMNGLYFKGAVDTEGHKLPAGAPRRDPWVVVEPVATAIAVLEQLHDQPVLFPKSLEPRRRLQNTKRAGAARDPQSVSKDLATFIDWVDNYAEPHNLPAIPADPRGALNISRFRRTLAWFIRRRPRGLVAGAIQYGHVHTRLIQGYAGTYDSGFPDEYAFEDFLTRLEELAEDQRALDTGEHVSGPAAHAYQLRVDAASKQFAGHVLTSSRQARDLLGNPLLQIFHGDGMTCVLDPAKAACQLRGTAEDPLVTPDISDCRPRCQNIARTDRDITRIRSRRDELAVIVADPLAPPIRHQREQHELDRLDTILENHR